MNSIRLTQSLWVPAALAAIVTLAACGNDNDDRGAGPALIQHSKGDGFAGTLVDDPPLRPAHVVLRDTQGERYVVSGRSPGRATALFFGFTRCGDVCPTTMADLAAAKRALPTDLAQKVDVLFVSVDPRRDTPRVLRRWLDRFGPGFIGLRGSIQQVHRVERSLFADVSAVDAADGHDYNRGQEARRHSHRPDVAGEYEVSHSGSVYIFGPRGESLLYSGGTTVGEYTRDLTRLLRRS